jgi:hypothetical protein
VITNTRELWTVRILFHFFHFQTMVVVLLSDLISFADSYRDANPKFTTAQGIYLITIYGAFVLGLSVGHSWLWLPVSCICAPMAWISGYWYQRNRFIRCATGLLVGITIILQSPSSIDPGGFTRMSTPYLDTPHPTQSICYT